MLGWTAGQAADRFGDRPAFVAGTWSLSFADLHRLSDEVAGGFAELGVRAGDVVGLVLPTAPEYPICYLAAAKLGAATAGVNTRLPATQRTALLDLVRPRLVVTADVEPTGRWPKLLIRPSPEGPDGLAGLRRPAHLPTPEDQDRPVAVVFTSGTTGTPRGAVFGWRQLDAIRRVDVGDRWGGGGAVLAGTSLAHLGFMTKLPGALRSGRTTHLMRRWDPAEALRLTATLGMTSLSGVPTQLALMLAAPALDELDLSGLRLVLIGGGPAAPALVRRARERFRVPVCTRYSCTEAGIGCATHPADPPEDAETTVGRPQPGVQLAVRPVAAPGDPDLPAETTGEVCLRSPAVMSGYWADQAATAAAFTPDGFVRTGDLGFTDRSGRLHLAGRVKEMYVRGGYNVFPVTVEAVLAEHPAVREVTVVPRSDPVMGETGVAVVVPNGSAPTLAELRRFAADRLASHQLPEALLVVDALPLTAGDKVDRPRLAGLAAARGRGD